MITGAVGIEMAAELKLVCPDLKVTLIHSRDKLLSAEPLPDEVKDRSLELVHEAGVEVLMSHRVDKTEEFIDNGHKAYKVYFTNGHTLVADSVIMAISRSVPSTTFLPREVLNEEGYVKIQPRYVTTPDWCSSKSKLTFMLQPPLPFRHPQLR